MNQKEKSMECRFNVKWFLTNLFSFAPVQRRYWSFGFAKQGATFK
jgi:hypothetical protein